MKTKFQINWRFADLTSRKHLHLLLYSIFKWCAYGPCWAAFFRRC